MLERGDDPEKVLQDIKWHQDKVKELGITLATVSTAMANSPSAIEGQDNAGGE
jgi:hypothetical protein